MRIRHKPWARPELAACSFFVEAPAEYRGRWEKAFPKQQPIWMELGCGKGGFMAQLAAEHPEINFLVLDIKSEMLALARRNLAAVDEDPAAHVRLMSQDIERIHLMMAPPDEVERIYINFCNPWPKVHDQKHRLTHTRQLMQYREVLKDGGEIWFRTDDDGLFEDSLGYFAQSSFRVRCMTRNLAESSLHAGPPTEHEKMFQQLGKTIKFLVAVKEPLADKEKAEGE